MSKHEPLRAQYSNVLSVSVKLCLEQTSLQTKTQAQTQESTIPGYVIETVSEPTQNLILSASDQPSSSSQILDQPPLNILESEYIEADLLKINEEMKALVQLRRVHTLSVDYEDHWSSLKRKVAALKRHLRILHSAEQSTRPLLYLANGPFYPESDYVSRETKVFKMLK